MRRTPTQKDDIDYFEKFTLFDVVGQGERTPEQQDQAEQLPVKAQAEEQKPAKTTSPEDTSASEESFVIVSDEDIVEEHLDEVFYGEKAPSEGLQQRDLHSEGEAAAMRMRRESQRSTKESGSVLFGSEETILTPIFISPGPPKIIDPILLEEPTAMSFMYSDLYEDAVGERKKSDEEHSEAESVASEKTYRRRLSDSEEADGYLEKFTLKDETPTVEIQPETPEDQTEGRMMWSQSKFEMTGCLTRVIGEEDKEKTKTEEQPTAESIAGETIEDIKLETFEDKGEIVPKKVQSEDETGLSTETEEMSGGEATLQSLPESQLKHPEIKHEAEKEQSGPEQSSIAEMHPGAEQVDCKEEEFKDQTEILKESAVTEGDWLSQTQDLGDPAITKTIESAVTTAASTEASCISHPPSVPSESTEEPREGEASDSLKPTAHYESATEVQAELKEPKIKVQGTCIPAEMEMSMIAIPHIVEEGGSDIISDQIASVEVIADCEGSVHALVEVSEEAVDDKEMQTQIQIDLQEVQQSEAEATEEVAVLEEEHQDLEEPVAAEGQAADSLTEPEQGSEDRTIAEAIRPGMLDKVNTDTNVTRDEIEAKLIIPPEGAVPEGVADTKPPSVQTSLMDSGNEVQEMVRDELIVLVPKGQSVEMDIEMRGHSEMTATETAAPPGVHRTFEDLTEPQTVTTMETQREPDGETQLEPQQGATDDVPNILSHEVCNKSLQTPPMQEEEGEEPKVEWDSEKDEAFFPPLRSFSAQEDLSDLNTQDLQLVEAGVEEETVEEGVRSSNVIGETASPQSDLHTEAEESKTEEVPKATEVIVEEPEYEVIYEKDTKETQRDEGKPASEPGQEEEEEKVEVEMEEEERVLGPSADDELIEADYDIIDAEEERQARLAAELQGLDWFCLTCGSLLAEGDCASEEHHGHRVTSVDSAYEEIKVKSCTFLLHPLTSALRVMLGLLEPIPAVMGQRLGYTLDRLSVRLRGTWKDKQTCMVQNLLSQMFFMEMFKSDIYQRAMICIYVFKKYANLDDIRFEFTFCQSFDSFFFKAVVKLGTCNSELYLMLHLLYLLHKTVKTLHLC